MSANTLLHCHFCIQIIARHFLLTKVSPNINTIPWINTHLLYPILFLCEYSISHKLLYCPVCIFWCFPGNQHCIISCHYFYTWDRGLQEVGTISTVRPFLSEFLYLAIAENNDYSLVRVHSLDIDVIIVGHIHAHQQTQNFVNHTHFY